MRNISSVWLLWLAVAGLAVHGAAQAPARSSAANKASALSQVAYIKASNPGEEDHFGHAVAVSGDGNTLAVGAPMESSASSRLDPTRLRSVPESLTLVWANGWPKLG